MENPGAFYLVLMNTKQTTTRGFVPIFFPNRLITMQSGTRTRRIRVHLLSMLGIWTLVICHSLRSRCDSDLQVSRHTWSSYSPPITSILFPHYLRCQLSIGDDFSNQAPLSVAGGVVDHLLPQQLAHRHVLEAVALGNLQALCSFATARAT